MGELFTDDTAQCCATCGRALEWYDCQECSGHRTVCVSSGSGIDHVSLMVACDACGGEGGYLDCPEARESGHGQFPRREAQP